MRCLFEIKVNGALAVNKHQIAGEIWDRAVL